MTSFGIVNVPTHYSIPPHELAMWAEAEGFDALMFGEHSHIPVRSTLRRPDDWYKMFFDPFVGLAASASVTTRIRLGTAVCLVTEHHPISLAKTVSCLDQVSNGRAMLGIGAGWNAPEMEDHGVAFPDRWKVTRERILAMREIWTNDVASFSGEFVDFKPLWSWPKPVQQPGPPVLIGSDPYPATYRRVVDYGDGWLPMDYAGLDLGAGLSALRETAVQAERPFDELLLAVITGTAATKGPEWKEERVAELEALGFSMILFLVNPDEPEAQWRVLEHYAAVRRRYA